MTDTNRREILQSAAAAPLCLGAPLRWLPGGDDRCLVVLELSGGNDGLNTVLPLQDPLYHKARPRLRAVRQGAHALQDGLALHPQLRELHRLHRDGRCSIIQGVGYPKPDRSHFRSRDIWYTADPDFDELQPETSGWLGRACAELAKAGAALPGLSIGSTKVPLALRSKEVLIPALHRIEEYQLLVQTKGGAGLQARRREALSKLVKADSRGKDRQDLRSFLDEVAGDAVDNAERLRQSLGRYRARARYPDTALGRKLQLLARVLVAGFGTRVFHLSMGGFDTHASQLRTHAGLLQQLSAGLGALVDDLAAQKALDRCVILVHSEFGRRVAENQSRGTDHGAAGPVFVLGSGLKRKLVGEHPSLAELDQGDLRQTCDFRRVYGEILRWMGVAPRAVLGAEHDKLALLA